MATAGLVVVRKEEVAAECRGAGQAGVEAIFVREIDRMGW